MVLRKVHWSIHFRKISLQYDFFFKFSLKEIHPVIWKFYMHGKIPLLVGSDDWGIAVASSHLFD